MLPSLCWAASAFLYRDSALAPLACARNCAWLQHVWESAGAAFQVKLASFVYRCDCVCVAMITRVICTKLAPVDANFAGMATQTMNALHPHSKACGVCDYLSPSCFFDTAAGGELRIVHIHGLTYPGVCVLGHVRGSIWRYCRGWFCSCSGGAREHVRCPQSSCVVRFEAPTLLSGDLPSFSRNFSNARQALLRIEDRVFEHRHHLCHRARFNFSSSSRS